MTDFGVQTCGHCGQAIPAGATHCSYCGAAIETLSWSTARTSTVHAKDMALGARKVSGADQAQARYVVKEAIETGATARSQAQQSLWAIEHAGTWRDLETAIAPAIGAPSVPPSGTWVVTEPKEEVELKTNDNRKTMIISIICTVALVALFSGIVLWNRDSKSDKASTTTTTTIAGTSPSTSAPSTTAPPANTTIPPGGPTTTTLPGATTVPGTPPPTTTPQTPAQSSANAAAANADAQARLQKVIDTVNLVVDAFNSDITDVAEQPYPRLPGFIDCYPTENDPLPAPAPDATSAYARANAQFYSSFTSPLGLDEIGQYFEENLVAAGLNYQPLSSGNRDIIQYLVTSDDITVTVDIENPSTVDQLLETHVLISGLDRCTRVQ